jgi:glyoxylase-like metal-dependent hydrolase (beta-lactamase superfamily II)
MLSVHKFTFNPFQENTYLIYGETGDCAIVDPGCYSSEEEKTLVQKIEELNLKPTLLLNTHCHIDHVFGNDFVFRKYGLQPHIHRVEQPVLDSVTQVAQMYGLNYTPSPDPIYFEGDTITLEDEELEILFVPGHAPGHVAFYNASQDFLIAGDVLFKQSIGRTDLPGGDMNTLLNSIKTQLFPLPDETIVYPGHMENTTIGAEKKNNPFLTGL